MDDYKKLREEVEQLQGLLHKVVRRKGIKSFEVIETNQAFRNKLREYYDLINQ